MLIIDKVYTFNPSDYADDGWKKEDTSYPLFCYIDECQQLFYNEFTPYVANILFVNPATARLLHGCYQFSEDEILGMDMINGEIDFEANFQMEEHSKKQMIYGIGCAISGHEEDQTVLVVLDDKLKNGEITLSYHQEYDNDDDGDEDVDPVTDDVLERERERVTVK